MLSSSRYTKHCTYTCNISRKGIKSNNLLYFFNVGRRKSKSFTPQHSLMANDSNQVRTKVLHFIKWNMCTSSSSPLSCQQTIKAIQRTISRYYTYIKLGKNIISTALTYYTTRLNWVCVQIEHIIIEQARINKTIQIL